jgi:ribosomal protein L5
MHFQYFYEHTLRSIYMDCYFTSPQNPRLTISTSSQHLIKDPQLLLQLCTILEMISDCKAKNLKARKDIAEFGIKKCQIFGGAIRIEGKKLLRILDLFGFFVLPRYGILYSWEHSVHFGFSTLKVFPQISIVFPDCVLGFSMAFHLFPTTFSKHT